MRSYLDVAVEAAREAGSILLAEFDRPQKIGYKGEADLITETDRRSEAAVVARLRTHFEEQAIVELAALIAFQNMSSKFNAALAVPPQGFCKRR